MSDHAINVWMLIVTVLSFAVTVGLFVIAINEQRARSATSLFQHSRGWWATMFGLSVSPLAALGFIALAAMYKTDLYHISYLFVAVAIILLILVAIARSGSASVMQLQPVAIPPMSQANSAEKVNVPHEVIRFDYLPSSPLIHGWKSGYSTLPPPSHAAWKAAIGAPVEGCMSMELSETGFAMDYDIGKDACLSTRLVCDVKFSNSTMIFVGVRLMTRDGSDKRQGFIKFDPIGGPPSFAPEYSEWVLPISPESLGNGWRHLDISLTDAVEKTWGREGWTLSELFAIRVRGNLSISPIKLY